MKRKNDLKKLQKQLTPKIKPNMSDKWQAKYKAMSLPDLEAEYGGIADEYFAEGDWLEFGDEDSIARRKRTVDNLPRSKFLVRVLGWKDMIAWLKSLDSMELSRVVGEEFRKG
jgi:hypothetical protein